MYRSRKHDFGTRISASILILNLLLLCLSGCGSKAVLEEAPVQYEVTIKTRYKENVVKDFRVPELKPLIKVNRRGYLAEGAKLIFFDTDREVNTFSVMNDATGENMGFFDVKTDENGLLCGDLTTIRTPGTYHIYNKQTGVSESFSISDTLYKDMVPELYEYIKTMPCDYEAALILLLIYEWDKAYCTDEVGIRESGNNLPDILDVVKGMLDGAAEPQTAYDSFMRAAALAQFSFFFAEYDAEGETKDYIAEAESLAKNNTAETDEEKAALYSAWSILYRTTEKNSYKTQLRQYLQKFAIGMETMPVEFYGDITYLNKRGEMAPTAEMNKLRLELEENAQRNLKTDNVLTIGKGWSSDEFVHNRLYMCVYSCISPSYEYQSYLLSGLDYYLGVNKEGYSFLDSEEAVDPKVPAILLFMICELQED